MNVVFVTPSLKTGGGNRVFIELANQLCPTYNVSIVCPNNSTDTHTFHSNSRIKINKIGLPRKSKLGKCINVLSTINYLNKNHMTDVIVISDPIFSIFAKLLKGKFIYRFIQADDYRIFDDGFILGHGLILKIYKRLIIYSYNNKKTKFIFNSKFTYDTVSELIKNRAVKYRLVSPAINSDIFKVQEKPEHDKLTIGLVGRSHPWKGISTFIESWGNLPHKYKERIGKVIFISHDDMSSFNLDGITVIKPNSDENIAKIYSSCDIFISTSWWEGFGLPPLEAMACGCSVICSKSGGVNEYTKDGENALMFEPKDSVGLGELIIKLIINNELRGRLSENGVVTAKEFSWKKTAQQFKNIIDKNNHQY